MVSRSSRRGTALGRCYASMLFLDSLRTAFASTSEKPPHTNEITKIIVIHVAIVMSRASFGLLGGHKLVKGEWLGKRPGLPLQ